MDHQHPQIVPNGITAAEYEMWSTLRERLAKLEEHRDHTNGRFTALESEIADLKAQIAALEKSVVEKLGALEKSVTKEISTGQDKTDECIRGVKKELEEVNRSALTKKDLIALGTAIVAGVTLFGGAIAWVVDHKSMFAPFFAS